MFDKDIETGLRFLPNKSNNGILGMDVTSLKESVPYIYVSLAKIINASVGYLWAGLEDHQNDYW